MPEIRKEEGERRMKLRSKVVGARLQAERKRAGLTQETLAEKANTSRWTIHRIEKGLYLPKVALLENLAHVLDRHMDDLLGYPKGLEVRATEPPTTRHPGNPPTFPPWKAKAISPDARHTSRKPKLPKHVRELFWEYPRGTISWPTDADLIARKILELGGWDSVSWLQTIFGKENLRAWFLRHSGAGLEPRKLRFWQLTIGLPNLLVERWIANNRSNPWADRLHR